MIFAYADPPYIGQSRKHYKTAEVDHAELIRNLRDEYRDGWALSCSSPSIEELSHLCRRIVGENVVRWGSWCKPFASYKPGVNPAYTWEPVILCGGRKRGRDVATVKDHHIESITLRKGLAGAKPLGFCAWVIDLLGARDGDTLVDLFPGSGAMQRAWSGCRSDGTWRKTVDEVTDAGR